MLLYALDTQSDNTGLSQYYQTCPLPLSDCGLLEGQICPSRKYQAGFLTFFIASLLWEVIKVSMHNNSRMDVRQSPSCFTSSCWRLSLGWLLRALSCTSKHHRHSGGRYDYLFGSSLAGVTCKDIINNITRTEKKGKTEHGVS